MSKEQYELVDDGFESIEVFDHEPESQEILDCIMAEPINPDEEFRLIKIVKTFKVYTNPKLREIK